MTSVRVRKICFIICICILLYAPLVQHVFETGSIYSNPFFRCLEFFIGMLLAAYKQDVSKKSKEVLYNWVTVIIATVIMFIGVSVGIRFGVGAGNYMLYSWICLPCFCLILFGLSGIKFKQRENRLLKMNGLPAYRQKSKAFVQKTLLERVPGELLWPQAMEELFERDYNTIREEIEEYRRSK